MRKIGENQKYMLYSLKVHKSWTLGCMWLWDTPSGTVRLLDSLVKRGLVAVKHEDRNNIAGSMVRPVYRLSKAGETMVEGFGT